MRPDDYIRDNVDRFNDEEPPEGHRERFERRLKSISDKKQNKTLISKNLLFYLSAAAVIIGIASSLLFIADNGNNANTLCLLSDEMTEAQNYYASELNLNVEKLEKILVCVDEETQTEIMSEIEIIMEDSKNLPSILCNDNDESFGILLEFYNSKIHTVQNIISIMESRNRTGNT